MPVIFHIVFLLFFFCSSSFADKIDEDIAASSNLDELIEKMNQAPHDSRYRYMNAIKKLLMSEKAQDRKSKLDSALKSHRQNSKSQKNQGGFGSGLGNSNQGRNGNGEGGGNGNGGGKR